MAGAASPTDRYLAARDRAIAAFKAADEAGPLDDAVFARHDRALADLGKLLEPVVGPVAIKGFPATGKISLDTLFPNDEGFGLLDGLVFASADGKAQVLVTTDELFRRWLPAHTDLSQAPAEALQADLFYTQAINTDSNFLRYAGIPVVAPAKATSVRAMLAVRAQELSPRVPDEIILAVAEGGRLYVASATVAAKVTAIPACDALWHDYQEKMSAALDAYNASDPKDDKLFDVYTALQEEADRAFRGCFAEHAPREAFFPALTGQAQAIVDALPARGPPAGLVARQPEMPDRASLAGGRRAS